MNTSIGNGVPASVKRERGKIPNDAVVSTTREKKGIHLIVSGDNEGAYQKQLATKTSMSKCYQITNIVRS